MENSQSSFIFQQQYIGISNTDQKVIPNAYPLYNSRPSPLNVKPRRQKHACEGCRLRRVRCDRADSAYSTSCKECSRKNIKCVDHVRAQQAVRDGRLISQCKQLFGQPTISTGASAGEYASTATYASRGLSRESSTSSRPSELMIRETEGFREEEIFPIQDVDLYSEQPQLPDQSLSGQQPSLELVFQDHLSFILAQLDTLRTISSQMHDLPAFTSINSSLNSLQQLQYATTSPLPSPSFQYQAPQHDQAPHVQSHSLPTPSYLPSIPDLDYPNQSSSYREPQIYHPSHFYP